MTATPPAPDDTPEQRIARLSDGWFNSDDRTPGNPGGLGDDGHVDNLPALLVDVGVAAQHVGVRAVAAEAAVQTVTDAADAAVQAVADAGDAAEQSVTALADTAAGSAAAAAVSASAAADSAVTAGIHATDAAASAAAAAASAAGVNLPPVTSADAGKVLTVTGGGTLAAVAPFVPGIATVAAAGLVKGGGNVGIGADGTLTASVSVQVNDVSIGSGITGLNIVGTTVIDGGVSSGVATIVVGAVPYRYLRITATASSHSTSFGLYYMDWRTVRVYGSVNATGTNLALGMAASASSTAIGRTPEAALDADDYTRWGTVNSPASLGWYQIDFGSTGLSVIPGSMTIYPADDGTKPYLPTQIIIGLSRDMATWISTPTISTSSATGTQAFVNLQFS